MRDPGSSFQNDDQVAADAVYVIDTPPVSGVHADGRPADDVAVGGYAVGDESYSVPPVQQCTVFVSSH